MIRLEVKDEKRELTNGEIEEINAAYNMLTVIFHSMIAELLDNEVNEIRRKYFFGLSEKN